MSDDNLRYFPPRPPTDEERKRISPKLSSPAERKALERDREDLREAVTYLGTARHLTLKAAGILLNKDVPDVHEGLMFHLGAFDDQMAAVNQKRISIEPDWRRDEAQELAREREDTGEDISQMLRAARGEKP